MMDFLMKQLGIDPEVVQKELPEAIKKIMTFDARLARIEKTLGCDAHEMQIAELTSAESLQHDT